MIAFQNSSVYRSASELLAELDACRQFRHVSGEEKSKIAEETFFDRKFIWAYEGFGAMLKKHGCACDVCASVNEVPDDHLRKMSDRILTNMEGLVKLCLCGKCDRLFLTFCQRQFQRSPRVIYTDDLEKMMLAFLSWITGRAARKVCNNV